MSRPIAQHEPTLPPELILRTLASLDILDPSTIQTLLAAQLVSSSFSALSKSAEIWAPLVTFMWERDRRSTSPLRAPTPYLEFVRRWTLEQDVKSGMKELVKAPWGRLPLVSALVKLGPDALPALAEIEMEREQREYEGDSDSDDSEDGEPGGVYAKWAASEEAKDWIPRLYWAEEISEMICRRDAWEVFGQLRQLGEGELDAGMEVRTFAAFDAFWSADQFETMQELSILNVFNGEERLPEDLRLRDVVRRVWASPVATTLRRKRGGLDSLFITCILDAVLVDLDDSDTDADASDSDSDFGFDDLGGGEQNSSSLDSAGMVPQAVVFCTLLRSLPAEQDVQAWPVVHLSRPAIAVARASDAPGEEVWGFLTLRDGVWHESSQAFRASLGAAATPLHMFKPTPTRFLVDLFASCLLHRGSVRMHPGAQTAACYAHLALTVGRGEFSASVDQIFLLRAFPNDLDLLEDISRALSGPTASEARLRALIAEIVQPDQAMDTPPPPETIKRMPKGVVKLGTVFMGKGEGEQKVAMVVTAWNPVELTRAYHGDHLVEGVYLCTDALGTIPYTVGVNDIAEALIYDSPTEDDLEELEEAPFLRSAFRSRVGNRFLPQPWISAIFPAADDDDEENFGERPGGEK